MKTLIAAASLVLAQIGGNANAGTIINTSFLSDISIKKVGDEFNINGTFYTPTVPAGSLPLFSVKYDIGIVTWTNAGARNTLGVDFSGGAGFQFAPSDNWCYCDRFSNSNEGERSSFSDTWVGGFTYSLVNDELSVDSPYAKDGLIPVHFRLWTTARGWSFPIGDPSYVAYFGNVRLKTVTTVNGPDGGNGDLASSDIVWSVAHSGTGGNAVPEELWSQLPSYIPHTIAAVPEPHTAGIMMVGLLALVTASQRRQKR